MEDLSSEDLRDLLRRERLAPAVVEGVWRRGIGGQELLELDTAELGQLGFTKHFAAQLTRVKSKLLSDPEWAHRCSEVVEDAAQRLDSFYRDMGVPDKAFAARKILCSHADDPTLLHKKLLEKYPEQADRLAFMRVLIDDHTRHTVRMSDLTKRLSGIFKVRGITQDDPQQLLQAFSDTPWALMDYLMDQYLLRPQELVFLNTWCTEVERAEIHARAKVDAKKRPAAGGREDSGQPPPPPGPPPVWSRRGVAAGSAQDGDDTMRLRCVLASCKEELRRQRLSARELHETHQATLRELHAVNKARHEDLAELHELRSRVASLEQVVQHRDAELLRMAKRGEVTALQRQLSQAQEAIVSSLDVPLPPRPDRYFSISPPSGAR